MGRGGVADGGPGWIFDVGHDRVADVGSGWVVDVGRGGVAEGGPGWVVDVGHGGGPGWVADVGPGWVVDVGHGGVADCSGRLEPVDVVEREPLRAAGAEVGHGSVEEEPVGGEETAGVDLGIVVVETGWPEGKMGSARAGNGRKVGPVVEGKGKVDCMEATSRVDVAGLVLGREMQTAAGTEEQVG